MNDWTLLIDFGTSFTRAAIADADGRIETIELDGTPAMPSGVWMESNGKLVAGLSAQRQAKLAPERWDRAPGRSLGLGGKLMLGPTPVDPVKAVAEVLRRIAAEGTRLRGRPPREVRLTCSPRWNETRRAALLAAARLAGLESRTAVPLQLVEYPIAAALRLAGAGRFRVGARIAVLGLGGGSAEAAVLESTPDGVVVRALGGIEGVGGEQFDDLLFRKVLWHKLKAVDSQLPSRLWEPPDVHWRRAAEGLFREVRRAKEALTSEHVVDLDTGELINIPMQLSRIELEAVLRADILRAARELGTTIELAGLRARQLDSILLTGQSARIPLVARAVFDVIGVHPEPLPDPELFLGAAAWTERSRVPQPATPLTLAGGQTREEAAADAAAAAAALAATGSIDLSALAPPRPLFSPPADGDGAAASRSGPSLWRRRWPVIVVVAVVLVLLGLALNGPALGDDDPDAPGPASSTGVDDPRAITGLVATTRTISIVLTWKPVPGAQGYTVRRDTGTGEETERTVAETTFTDRPGDGDPHRYTVVALGVTDDEGPPAEVTATAEAPYGEVQEIASDWTAVVPISPEAKGSAGQTCKGSETTTDLADGRIRCTFGNGVRIVISRYPSPDDRDRRKDQLADRKGVKEQKWSAELPGGDRFAGRLLVADGKATGGPWRWWTYDRASTYSLQADWPKHSAKQLSRWWNEKAPFRI